MHHLTRLALAHRAVAGVALAAITAVLALGALRIETDVGYRSLLGRHHPSVERLDVFLERFGGGFPLAAVYRCADTLHCDSVFDPAAIAMAARVAAALEDVPALRHVESIATAPLRVPDGDGGAITRHFADAAPELRPELAQRALRDSLWPRHLLGDDGRVGAIVMEVASSSSADNVAAYEALDAALAPLEAEGWRFARVGGPVEFVVAGAELQADTARLIPAMLALIAAVVLALFRSVPVTAAALATVGLAVLWAFGFMGWMGWPQNSITQALAPLLLVIGVCDVLHVLSRYASDATERPDAPRAALLEDVARDVGPACVATSVTTAAAFASFATSGLESFVRFGFTAAFGVIAALGLCFCLLPLLAVHIRPDGLRAERASRRWDALLRPLVDIATARAGRVLAVTALLTLGVGLGLPQVRFTASFEDLYGEDSRVVRWSRLVSDHLRRPDTLEVALQAPEGTPAADPESLQTVERVGESLAEIEGLGPARSLADAVALAYQLANGDEPFWRRVPGRSEDLREVIDALEEEDPRAVAHLADLGARRFRVSVEAEKLPQDEMHRVFDEIGARLADALPPGWSAEATGPLVVVRDMVDEIQRTQLSSFASAAGVVLVLSALFLRSLSLGLLALIPTVLPVVVTLGAMGHLGRPLDIGGAMVAAIVVGIAVDDSLHLLTQYARRRSAGEAPLPAMEYAVHHVGRAVVTTSVALALGFSSLAISSWKSIADFGALAAAAILCALVAVLLVLPALVAVMPGSTRASRAPAGATSRRA
jgi:uncharacterized protein